MNRARRSFPDPLSPVISTVESTCATRRARSSVRTIAGPELVFLLLEDVGQLCERRVEARLPIERQMHREFRPPVLLRADDRPTNRIAFAPTAVFDGDDLFAIDA